MPRDLHFDVMQTETLTFADSVLIRDAIVCKVARLEKCFGRGDSDISKYVALAAKIENIFK